ncbi:MAG: hypothetical protein IK104_04415 [Clostridia bacterium]|nr:hypothetical protein [Clostridia bacterium]
MKQKFIGLAAVLLALTLLFAACGDDGDVDPVTEAPSSVTDDGSTAAPTSEEPSIETTEPEQSSEDESSEAVSDDETTEEAPTGFSSEDLEKVNKYLPEGQKLGFTGWCETARGMYETACVTFFKTMFTSDWLELDYDVQNGPAYTKVTNFGSVEDVSADFFEVFTKETFATAPYDRFQEKDGVLYAAVADRDKDPTYRGYEISAVAGIIDGEIEFAVIMHFSSRDVPTTFSLKYERGAYRVNRFVMPY